jgi:hypothetical protein
MCCMMRYLLLLLYIKVGGTNYINDLATDLQLGASSNTKIVATAIVNVNTVGTNIAKVDTVGTNIAKVSTVSTDLDLGASSNIEIVSDAIASVITTAGSIADVSTVATDIANTNTVAGSITNVNLTGGSIANVNTVATDIANINTNATNIANINTNATNILAIQNADANATIATTQAGIATTEATVSTTQAGISTAQATIATTQAGIATTKADTIIAIDGNQVALTLAAGSVATAYYNTVTGKFTFGVPQGVKGDKGDAFQVNAVGLLASRSLYDTQIAGFSFLAIDDAEIYFKLSGTSGDWSVAAPFGKGDTGNGIANIAYTSTTGTAQGQAGETDTYTITYTDTATDIFVVTNGTTDHALLTNIGTNTHAQIDTALTRLVNTSGTNTGDQTTITGNAGTATKLATTRAIALTGAVTGTANFDGSANISITTTNTADPVITLAGDATGSVTLTNLASGTLTVAVVDNSHNHTSANISDATNLNTASMIVKRDASGNFTAGTVTAALTGNATSATTLQTARTINGVSFNGSADITVVDSTKAPLASPALTGTPTAPTATGGTNDTQLATTAFVASALGSIEGVPAGVITMWSGLIAAIPSGWFLCNGANSTPDLRGRFVYGASIDGDVNVTGGSADAIVVSHTHTTPAHTHTASSNSRGAHTHTFGVRTSSATPGSGVATAIYANNTTATTISNGAHSHTITVASGGAGTSGTTGSSGTNANLPPYMKLAYIMKG